MDVAFWRGKLKKPLLPGWIIQTEPLPSILENGPYHRIICCTASRRVEGAEMSEGGYIQGAGDDSEGWSHGLTATMFWQNKDRLMKTSEEELPEVIRQLVAKEDANKVRDSTVVVTPTNLVYLGVLCSNENMWSDEFSCSIICGELQPAKDTPETKEEDCITRTLYLDCGSGKLGSRALRTELQHLQPFMQKVLPGREAPTMLVSCSTGRDISVGVALAVLCLYFADDGTTPYSIYMTVLRTLTLHVL